MVFQLAFEHGVPLLLHEARMVTVRHQSSFKLSYFWFLLNRQLFQIGRADAVDVVLVLGRHNRRSHARLLLIFRVLLQDWRFAPEHVLH